MSEAKVSNEQRSIGLTVIGSIFGIATGFLATYNILGSILRSQTTPTTQLLIEAVLWAVWVGLQGIGFYVIYTRNRQSVFVGTGVVGLLAMALEVIALYQIWNSIQDVAFALIGISVTTLYILMAGYSMTLLRPNDSLGKVTGNTFIVTGIVLLVFPPVGFVLLALSNLLAVVFYVTLDQTVPTAESTGVPLV